MNGINPTVNYGLVTADQARRRAHAERRRMFASVKPSHAGDALAQRGARHHTLTLRQRLAVAAATLVVALSAAAATVVATDDDPGPQAGATASER